MITGNKTLIPAKAKHYNFDIADESSMQKILKENKFDIAMHFAGLTRVDESVKYPEKYQLHNFEKSKIFFSSCIKNNLKKIIFSSSAGVYGNSNSNNLTEDSELKPINPYADSKYKIENFFAEGLPNASGAYKGFPEYNFVGGHNSEKNIPVKELVKSAESVILREGKNLALYGHNSGPQGNLALRDFLVNYLEDYIGMRIESSNILLTSGSLQALDLVNTLLLQKGDTVLVEEATYGGAISRLESLGVKHEGVKLDNEGICTDHLVQTLESLNAKGVFPKYYFISASGNSKSFTLSLIHI